MSNIRLHALYETSIQKFQSNFTEKKLWGSYIYCGMQQLLPCMVHKFTQELQMKRQHLDQSQTRRSWHALSTKCNLLSFSLDSSSLLNLEVF
jgi:hypothetical protein